MQMMYQNKIAQTSAMTCNSVTRMKMSLINEPTLNQSKDHLHIDPFAISADALNWILFPEFCIQYDWQDINITQVRKNKLNHIGILYHRSAKHGAQLMNRTVPT